MSEPIILYFDGASKRNPGPSGGGYYVVDGKNEYGGYIYLGEQTNNYAEYMGLITGLKAIMEHKDRQVEVRGDSNLVIQQMKLNWRVKAENLIPLWTQARLLAKSFKNITFTHIDNRYNSKADNFANIAIATESSNSV